MKTITFPHMGNYQAPIEMMLRRIFPKHKILPPPPITKRTLELGSRHSPEFVCIPFKYNVGNYIEALENGADVLIQAGGGCRYGYYAEAQEQILRDLGYRFEFVRLLNGGLNPVRVYNICKKLGSTASIPEMLGTLALTVKAVKVLDALERRVRENIGFETIHNSFETAHKNFLRDLKQVTGLQSLQRLSDRYTEMLNDLPVDKPPDCLKVGIVGELYTNMEPFSNYFMEKQLAKNNIQVSRFITVTFLLFEKSKTEQNILRQAGKYLKYTIGADGATSVANSVLLADAGYDGIIHVKPFGCTPEVNAMPMLQKISRDRSIPVLHFSFDSQTSETGIATRLEAFYDMMMMKRGIEV